MSVLKNHNYITLQGWMVTELELKGEELIIYAAIYQITEIKDTWTNTTLEYLKAWTMLSGNEVIKILDSLQKRGLINYRVVYENQGLIAVIRGE